MVSRNFISCGVNVGSPEKSSHILRTLSLQPCQKLKRENVIGTMEERGGGGMPEGKAGKEEVEGVKGERESEMEE